jgi:hypothetical protein
MWLIVAAIIALTLLPAALRAGVRRARLTRPLDDAEAAESAWIELRDHIRDLRLPWTGSMTPRARERDVAGWVRGDREGLDALHRLAMCVERARYSAVPEPTADPAAEARTVMASISGEADRWQRVRAFLWPSSLMPDLRRGWDSLSDRLRRRPSIT